MPFTAEQEAIIASTGRIVSACAFAGTGKSTTLRGFAAARPNERGLLVAFNKAIQLDAESTFPSTVRCRTSHALAFAAVGRLYASGEKLQPDIKPFHVTACLSAATRTMPASVARIFEQRVIETVKAYLSSDASDLTEDHVVWAQSPAEVKHFGPPGILQGAKRVWALMQDVNSSLPMIHDGYLKLYQLMEPKLRFDYILFDEAQDTSPAVQAIMRNQECRVIYVGDAHQAIYGWRGANNVMETLAADQTFHLTGSFRFGPKVAAIANLILALKGETVAVRGLGHPTRIFEEPYGNPRGTAFISRTNATIFRKAERAALRGIPVAFIGGVGAYKFEVGEDIARLRDSGAAEVRNPFIASFDNFASLLEYAEAVGDKELSGWAKVVDEYGVHFGEALQRIRGLAVTYDAANPAVTHALTVVTAHRSKGLEFDRVELADNFVETLDDAGDPIDFTKADRETREEINLLYVAATRARRELVINSSIRPLVSMQASAEECRAVESTP